MAASKRSADASAVAAPRRRFTAIDIILNPAARLPKGLGAPCLPVSVAVFKWSDDSQLLFLNGRENTPVYQVQVIHDTRPSIAYGFLTAFRAFLPTWDADVQSLDELEQKHFIRVVMASGGKDRDPDDVGIKALVMGDSVACLRPLRAQSTCV